MAKDYYNVRLKKTARGPRTRMLLGASFTLDEEGEDAKVLFLDEEVVLELRANGSWDIDKAAAPEEKPGGIGTPLFENPPVVDPDQIAMEEPPKASRMKMKEEVPSA